MSAGPHSLAARQCSLWSAFGSALRRRGLLGPWREAPRAASATSLPSARARPLPRSPTPRGGRPRPPQCPCLGGGGPLPESGKWVQTSDLSNPENKTRGPTQGSPERRAGGRLASTWLFTQRFPNCSVSGPLYTLRNY